MTCCLDTCSVCICKNLTRPFQVCIEPTSWSYCPYISAQAPLRVYSIPRQKGNLCMASEMVHQRISVFIRTYVTLLMSCGILRTLARKSLCSGSYPPSGYINQACSLFGLNHTAWFARALGKLFQPAVYAHAETFSVLATTPTELGSRENNGALNNEAAQGLRLKAM